MKKLSVIIAFFLCAFTFAQKQMQQFPQFSTCENQSIAQQKNCFFNYLQDYFYSNFKVPQHISAKNYNGTIKALFEVDTLGKFKAVYVETDYIELKEETQRVFNSLENVKPAQYAGKKTFSQYTIRIKIPLEKPIINQDEISQNSPKTNESGIDNSKILTEFDSIKTYTFKNPHYKSALNMPFTHLNYSVFDALLNQVGSNNHTASKPYSYAEVSKYYDIEAAEQLLAKNASGWWSRKLWNENLVTIQGERYWFIINPILDLRIGKDFDSEKSNTFINTRGVSVQGGLGNELVFSTSIYESQGRFADYYNAYAESLKPSGGNPAIIPGIGIAKPFKTDAYDFPMAEAQLKYSPNEFINLQLGYNRNFIGDGYRSILQGDATSPYPYFKINTTFWKLKYTNTYMWLKDVREDVTAEGTYATKYMASHYLSLNVSKKLNFGFFENVVWTNTNDRGFDFNFVNPIIFYRAVEFTSSSKTGNALLGLTSKYKFNNQINFYAQFLVDEFSIADVKERNKSWRNKFGYQIGAKYYEPFNVKNLQLQLEYNVVRPYVYAHSNPLTNYAHNNQSMGHNWGANFKEVVTIARYHKQRYFAEATLLYGKRGYDFNTTEDTYNYGGNIYLDYEENRPFDTGVVAGQGNTANYFFANLNAGYLVNPATNLRAFASFSYRNFSPKLETDALKNSTTAWFSFGIRTDLFNWYFDY